jgi:hypothetical protein
MPISRPLPKALLKKMFLKVLYEHHRLGGTYQHHGRDFNGIVRYRLSEYVTTQA